MQPKGVECPLKHANKKGVDRSVKGKHIAFVQTPHFAGSLTSPFLWRASAHDSSSKAKGGFTTSFAFRGDL